MSALQLQPVPDEAARDFMAHQRAIKRMEVVDQMPADLRACVHEFGLTIVLQMLNAGVTKARVIRHLITTVRAGSVEIGNRNLSLEQKQEMDRRSAGRLRNAGLLVVPEIPTDAMVQASIDALCDAGLADSQVDRRRKHTVRLLAANVAGHSGQFGKV
jgi:hypothetical protein